MKQDIIYFISFGFFNYHYPEEPKGFLPGLKIGYTSNWETRKMTYQKDLLDYEVISFRPGDEVLEQAIHLWYSDYRLRIRRLTEWFRDYDYIRGTFDIIPDEVFLRYSENLHNPRELNNLYNFGLKYLLKFPEDPFQQDQLWRLAVGSTIELNSLKEDLTESTINQIYEFSSKYLNISLKNIEDILLNLYNIKDSFELIIKEDLENYSLSSQAQEILSFSTFDQKMKKCCEYYSISSDHPIFNYLPEKFKYYLDILGISGISRVSYKEANLRKEISKCISTPISEKESIKIISKELQMIYSIGNRITLKELKETFRQIKEKYSLLISPKASLIKNFCEVKRARITLIPNSPPEEGFEILSFLQ